MGSPTESMFLTSLQKMLTKRLVLALLIAAVVAAQDVQDHSEPNIAEANDVFDSDIDEDAEFILPAASLGLAHGELSAGGPTGLKTSIDCTALTKAPSSGAKAFCFRATSSAAECGKFFGITGAGKNVRCEWRKNERTGLMQCRGSYKDVCAKYVWGTLDECPKGYSIVSSEDDCKEATNEQTIDTKYDPSKYKPAQCENGDCKCNGRKCEGAQSSTTCENTRFTKNPGNIGKSRFVCKRDSVATDPNFNSGASDLLDIFLDTDLS